MKFNFCSYVLLVLLLSPAGRLVAQEPKGAAKEKTTKKKQEAGTIEVLPVTGSRLNKTQSQDVTKIEIDRGEAELVAPSGDVAQVVKLFPGTIARPQDSEVSVRGSRSNDTLYLVDDLQAPNIFDPISGTSVIPSKAISSILFYPGNFSAEYGGITGGVVKLETRDEDIIEPYAEFRLNMPIYTSAYYENEVALDHSVIFSARKSILEPFVKKAVTEPGQFIVPYFQDVYLQHYTAGDDVTVKTRYLHSLSGAKLRIYNERATESDGTIAFDFENRYDLFGVDITKRLGDLNFEFAPYATKRSTEFSVTDTFFEIKTDLLVLPVRTQVNVSSSLDLFFGVQAAMADFSLNAKIPSRFGEGAFSDPENSKIVNLDVSTYYKEYAGWAAAEFAVGDALLTPSVRVFQQNNMKEGGLDPRFAARYAINPSQVVKFGIGQYSSPPQPEQIAPGFGNEDLSYIKSNHYTLGWESRPGSRWNHDIQLFYKTWDDDVFDDPNVVDNPKQRFRAETERKSQGFELFSKYSDDSGLFGWVSYTYSVTKEKRGKGAKEILSDTDSTHILHLVANYKLSPTFQIGSRLKHQTGYVYTPIDTVFYQTNTDTYSAQENPSLINSQRVPDTTTFSLFAQKDIPYDHWNLVVRFGFEEYQFNDSSPNITYNYDYSKKKYATGLPVIPFVELRAIL